jgi:hypothetical protein
MESCLSTKNGNNFKGLICGKGWQQAEWVFLYPCPSPYLFQESDLAQSFWLHHMLSSIIQQSRVLINPTGIQEESNELARFFLLCQGDRRSPPILKHFQKLLKTDRQDPFPLYIAKLAVPKP